GAAAARQPAEEDSSADIDVADGDRSATLVERAASIEADLNVTGTIDGCRVRDVEPARSGVVPDPDGAVEVVARGEREGATGQVVAARGVREGEEGTQVQVVGEGDVVRALRDRGGTRIRARDDGAQAGVRIAGIQDDRVGRSTHEI